MPATSWNPASRSRLLSFMFSVRVPPCPPPPAILVPWMQIWPQGTRHSWQQAKTAGCGGRQPQVGAPSPWSGCTTSATPILSACRGFFLQSSPGPPCDFGEQERISTGRALQSPSTGPSPPAAGWVSRPQGSAISSTFCRLPVVKLRRVTQLVALQRIFWGRAMTVMKCKSYCSPSQLCPPPPTSAQDCREFVLGGPVSPLQVSLTKCPLPAESPAVAHTTSPWQPAMSGVGLAFQGREPRADVDVPFATRL